MANFFSGVWDFIVWLFPWIFLGLGVWGYFSIEPNISSNKNIARKYLFISIALAIAFGIVTPIYFRTSAYWTVPLIFWSGFLILFSLVFYSKSDFVEGVFGLGMATITEYILSFYNEANPGLFFILRFVFLFFVVFACIQFALFLNGITKQEVTEKKSLTPRKIHNDIADQYNEVKQDESPAPHESGGKKIEEAKLIAKVDSERNKGWEKTLKIVASILGIMLLLLQLASQALDVLQKIP